jgi:hypothetical protein
MVKIAYKCEVCGDVGEDEAKMREHEQQPLTGLEFQVGSLFGMRDPTLLRLYILDMHNRISNKEADEYLGREIMLITKQFIHGTDHERYYVVNSYFRGLSEKEERILEFLRTPHINEPSYFSEGVRGSDLVENLRELSEEEYRIAFGIINSPGSSTGGLRNISELANLRQNPGCMNLELSKGILPKEN